MGGEALPRGVAQKTMCIIIYITTSILHSNMYCDLRRYYKPQYNDTPLHSWIL